MLHADDLVIIAKSLKKLGAIYYMKKFYGKTELIISDVKKAHSLPLLNIHVEFVVKVLILTSSFAIILFTGCIRDVITI